jgi:ergot alkaloid biosynthesis protein
MSPLILVTGGTGKTGARLVAQLRQNGHACRSAARSVTATEHSCPFDWTHPQSWAQAIENVSAIYLVAPAIEGDPAQVVIDFARMALERGVARFVLLSASLLPAGGPAMGQVHQWLQQNEAEWTVLRPSWFMQNFSEGQHLATIREESKIYSATADGRIPFIGADDIAAAAMSALTCKTPLNKDFILTGSQLLTYGEVAERIGQAVGRTISHRRLSASELAAHFQSLGLGSAHAQMLAAMDSAIAAGAEDRTTTCIEQLTGRPPTAFDEFVRTERANWSA